MATGAGADLACRRASWAVSSSEVVEVREDSREAMDDLALARSYELSNFGESATFPSPTPLAR